MEAAAEFCRSNLQMTDKVRTIMAKASQVDEVCHKLPTMILLSQYYPNHSSTATQMPSDDHQVAAAGPKQRRRRRKRKEGGADNLCRKKRNLTTEQTRLLEMSFSHEQKLASARKDRLAAELGLDPRKVAVWFQNRRARWKSKQLEGEYSRLKASRDINMLEKCRLEAEVFKLREQLVEAEKKIMSLQSSRGGGDGVGAASAAAAGVAEGERHYSPSTSMSTAETFEQVSFDQHFHDYEDDIFFFIAQNEPNHWPIW